MPSPTDLQRPSTLDLAFSRFRRGRDPDDFARFFVLGRAAIQRAAAAMCAHRATADDLVQTTFVAALEHADRFDPRCRVLPWLLGILRNRMRQHRRTRERAVDPDRVRRPREPADPADLAETRDLDLAVRCAIARLRPPYRAVLALHRDGLTPIEISS